MSNLPREVFIRGKARKEHHPPHIGVGNIVDREKQSLNPALVQIAAYELPARLLGIHHTHRSRDIDEPNTWKSSLDQQNMTGGSRELCRPQQRQIQEEVERLLTEQLHDFPHNETIDNALRWDMTNISESSFNDKIKQTGLPHIDCLV